MNGDVLDRGDAAEQLIVALDVGSYDEAMVLAEVLAGTCRWVKVGMELYYAAGERVIAELTRRGFRVFLDLKLHDIPNTVTKAVQVVAGTGASLLTIHAGGGMAMMEAAVRAAAGPGAPRLLAVTVLTSMDAAELSRTGVSGSPIEQVLRLGRLAKAAGVSGLVCSAEEVGALRAELGPGALLVTPGIRPGGTAVGDQRRVATPALALERGASMLVVGRPITEATDPAAAARAILTEMQAANGGSGETPQGPLA